MRMSLRIVLIVVAVIIAIQFIPALPEKNPPPDGEIVLPPDVAAVFERSCYNCHSYKTRWPWYSNVAPVSWLVGHDVGDGREHLNFSTWEQMDAKKQKDKTKKIWEEVNEGEMPPSIYLVMHSNARLSDADKEVIQRWTGGKSREADDD